MDLWIAVDKVQSALQYALTLIHQATCLLEVRFVPVPKPLTHSAGLNSQTRRSLFPLAAVGPNFYHDCAASLRAEGNCRVHRIQRAVRFPCRPSPARRLGQRTKRHIAR